MANWTQTILEGWEKYNETKAIESGQYQGGGTDPYTANPPASGTSNPRTGMLPIPQFMRGGNEQDADAPRDSDGGQAAMQQAMMIGGGVLGVLAVVGIAVAIAK